MLVLLAGLAPCWGCGYSGGQLLWAMGFGRSQRVDPEFELNKDGTLLVLVDDPEDRLISAGTGEELARRVSEDLKAHKAAGRIVPPAKLAELRRQRQDFEEVSCRQLGELAGADQVLWLEVRDFHASEEVEETGAAARMAVTVKVISARATERGDVRLWPVDRQGRILTTELHANQVLRAKTPLAIATLLTHKMAREVGKLFYEHALKEE